MEELSQIQRVAVWALPVLFAITVHEVAHGWVAKCLGDPTAKMMGRLTLNPLKHIDPVGTVLLPLIMLWVGGFVFGWAKPVPVTWENLRHPKRDMALVAIAGPMSNFLMAIFWAVLMKIAMLLPASANGISLPLIYMGGAGIFINAILMVLNLFPLPPLDGSRVVSALLPGPWAYRFSRIEPFGFPILIVLLMTGMLGIIISPPLFGFQSLLYRIFGL
jgi:Zn-dependent protease